MFFFYFQSMATVNTTSQCSTCNKETGTYLCDGCSQRFCRSDSTKHFQVLGEQLNQTITEYDQFLQKLLHQKDGLRGHLFIKEINRWEMNSIEKIKQVADKCRERLTKSIENSITKIENQLNDLAKQLKTIRVENEYNEIDSQECQNKLKTLEDELDNPTNVSVEKRWTLFIDEIFVVTPFEKGTKKTN